MQSPPNTLISLADQFAERIAHCAQFVGLDDPEEMLLWRYFALKKEHASPQVIACLKNQAELNAFEIKSIEASATLDAKWVKPSGLFKVQKPLEVLLQIMDKDEDSISFSDQPAILDEAKLKAQRAAFELWYSKIQAQVIEGKIKEVASDDIEVKLNPLIIDLKKLLLAI